VLPFELGSFGFELFTLVPVDEGVAVFGLLDKYLNPAAITFQRRQRIRLLFVCERQEISAHGLSILRQSRTGRTNVAADSLQLPTESITNPAIKLRQPDGRTRVAHSSRCAAKMTRRFLNKRRLLMKRLSSLREPFNQAARRVRSST
jgi:hypothetical protein